MSFIENIKTVESSIHVNRAIKANKIKMESPPLNLSLICNAEKWEDLEAPPEVQRVRNVPCIKSIAFDYILQNFFD